MKLDRNGKIQIILPRIAPYSKTLSTFLNGERMLEKLHGLDLMKYPKKLSLYKIRMVMLSKVLLVRVGLLEQS